MFCCEKCFKDPELIAIIQANKVTGNCDFCGSKNVNVLSIEEATDIRNDFESLLDIYIPVVKTDDSETVFKNIYETLSEDWSIFNLDESKIEMFLKELFLDSLEDKDVLFKECVCINGLYDEGYQRKYSLLKDKIWDDFVEEIKKKNRFHTDIINKDILRNICEAACKRYNKGAIFYRARVWNSNKAYEGEDMGAPPYDKASAGRANPEGISCLYLANSVDTVLHEIRAGVHDSATVAAFELKKDIEVVNLAAIDKISPFQIGDINLIACNAQHLKKISYEISKPLRRHDSQLDYIPTQYISEFIKSIGFSGIEYKSAMFSQGTNLAIFDEKNFECIRTKSYNISSINYKYDEINE